MSVNEESKIMKVLNTVIRVFCIVIAYTTLGHAEPLRIQGLEIVSLNCDDYTGHLVAIGKGEVSEPDRWFILNSSGDAQEVEPPARFFARFHGMLASADGRFLAIQSSGEGHPAIDIIDLPHFIKSGQTRSVGAMTTYPGYLRMAHWENGGLYFTSDMLCLPIAGSWGNPDVDYFNFTIELPESKMFVFNPDTGMIKAVSKELADPVNFFGNLLLDPDHDLRQREIGTAGLLKLGGKGGVPFLKRALKIETDKEQILWLKDAIEYLESNKQ